ncbi:MAG: response regulator receiver protein [Moraxellaceae bacterium]|jgi:CheY-like chemotaxis protein|nr:response regulator receiver protein [Moraxellaceae bacterium]
MNPPGLRILLVDDSLLQQRYLQELLAGFGFDFLLAADGAAGVEAALRHRPDIILMDIEMPVMDGLQAAQRIRECPETVDTPIVMVTSRGEADYMESAFCGGCNDYITKPVHLDELLAKIASLTGFVPGAHA